MHLKMSWPKEKGDGGVGVAKKMLSPATRPEQKKKKALEQSVKN